MNLLLLDVRPRIVTKTLHQIDLSGTADWSDRTDPRLSLLVSILRLRWRLPPRLPQLTFSPRPLLVREPIVNLSINHLTRSPRKRRRGPLTEPRWAVKYHAWSQSSWRAHSTLCIVCAGNRVMRIRFSYARDCRAHMALKYKGSESLPTPNFSS